MKKAKLNPENRQILIFVVFVFCFIFIAPCSAQTCLNRAPARKYKIKLVLDDEVVKYRVKLKRVGSDTYNLKLFNKSSKQDFTGTVKSSCGDFDIVLPVSRQFTFSEGGEVKERFHDNVEMQCSGFIQPNKVINGTCEGFYSHVFNGKLFTFNLSGTFKAKRK